MDLLLAFLPHFTLPTEQRHPCLETVLMHPSTEKVLILIPLLHPRNPLLAFLHPIPLSQVADILTTRAIFLQLFRPLLSLEVALHLLLCIPTE